MKIYHNPRCKKSRETLKIIEEKGIKPEIIKYLETPPSKEELEQLLYMLGLDVVEIIRKQEKIFKENYKNKEFSHDQWIDILLQNPKLIKRPIVVKEDKAILGLPPENVLNLL